MKHIGSSDFQYIVTIHDEILMIIKIISCLQTLPTFSIAAVHIDHIRPTFADPYNFWSTPGFECNGQGGSAEGRGMIF